jgi:hypothetical protein
LDKPVAEALGRDVSEGELLRDLAEERDAAAQQDRYARDDEVVDQVGLQEGLDRLATIDLEMV